MGPYRLGQMLGRGGMGVVYEARHHELPRPVAVKLLSGLARGVALERFQREAECLARVRHPNVLGVHEAGDCALGPYLVTDLVEGRPLVDFVDEEQPNDPRWVAEVVRALGDALAAVHAQGVVHRDVKPQNVIVRPDGSPVLLDFGLALDLDAETLTKTGQLIGTPSYMAPEQARGAGKVVLDERTDVYGLGATLFALLAGRPPFEGGVALFVIRQVATVEPSWPSDDRPDTPPGLEAICRRAMAKDPAERQQSAAALRDELAGWLRGDAPAVAPPPRARHRRRVRALAAGGALLLLAGAGLAAKHLSGGAPEPAGAASPSQTAGAGPTAAERGPPRDLRRLPQGPARLSAYLALRTWLREHADAPGRATALRELRAARGAPLAVWERPALRGYVGVAARDARHALLFAQTSPEVELLDLQAEGPGLRARGPGSGGVFAATPLAGGAFAFAGEGRRVLRASEPSGAAAELLWQAPAETPLPGGVQPLSGRALAALALAAAPDGRLATGGDWAEVQVLGPDGAPLRALGPHGDSVDALAFTPDGARLVSITGRSSSEGAPAGDDNALRVFDLESGTLLRRVECPTRPLSLALSPDGQRAVVGTRQWSLHAYELETGREAPPSPRAPDVEQAAFARARAHSGTVIGVAFAADGLLYSASSDGDQPRRELRVWRVTSEAFTLLRTTPLDRPASALALTPDGACVLLAGEGGLAVWAAGAE
ncbi:MAG: WD40 repeat domain-containing serine/threonine protein kinase [Planctomycetota bacterium]